MHVSCTSLFLPSLFILFYFINFLLQQKKLVHFISFHLFGFITTVQKGPEQNHPVSQKEIPAVFLFSWGIGYQKTDRAYSQQACFLSLTWMVKGNWGEVVDLASL